MSLRVAGFVVPNMTTTNMFSGNSTFPYTKGAMLASMGARIAGCMQAGSSENAPDQRILCSVSEDGGRTFPRFQQAVPSTDGPQWEPVLHYAPPRLWLIYSEGSVSNHSRTGPQALWAAASLDGGHSWGARRLIFNASVAGWPRVW